jgi:hypothetical protein
MTAASILTVCSALAVADQRAKTEDGKEVILRDDGTWVYADAPTKAATKPKAGGEYVKDKNARLAYTGKNGNFALYLVPNRWRQSPMPNNPDAEAQFIHKDGDSMAMVISERISIPVDVLKNVALEKMRSVDKDARVVNEETRNVNGKEVMCLTTNVIAQGVPFTFYAYYFSGTEGSIQIVTWTGQNLFKEVKPELEAFLNGFVTLKKRSKQ